MHTGIFNFIKKKKNNHYNAIRLIKKKEFILNSSSSLNRNGREEIVNTSYVSPFFLNGEFQF